MNKQTNKENSLKVYLNQEKQTIFSYINRSATIGYLSFKLKVFPCIALISIDIGNSDWEYAKSYLRFDI